MSYPDPQHAMLELALDSPGLVVLADVYYPGWELTIDGKPAPIYRVNGAMRERRWPKGPTAWCMRITQGRFGSAASCRSRAWPLS